MKDKLKIYWERVGALQGVVIFMCILFIANFIWKLSVRGDDADTQVLLFNTFDITAPFKFMVVHITKVVKTTLLLLGYHIHGRYVNEIFFDNHTYIVVIWGCTAIKQAFIFLCIMIFTQGPWKPKLWFVPLGLFIIYLFNILRIFLIALVVQSHPEHFYIFHEVILKYLFYGVIFLYWVIWEEKINQRRKKIDKIEVV
jgi:exosortase/archaeosortase family protein